MPTYILKLTATTLAAFCSISAYACTCFGQPSFCKELSYRIEYQSNYSLVEVEVLDLYFNGHPDTAIWEPTLGDFRIVEHFSGTPLPADTMTFIGQDGLNCNFLLRFLEVGQTYWILVNHFDAGSSYTNPNTNETYTFQYPSSFGFNLCGVTAVKLESDTLRGIFGDIYPDVDLVPLADFNLMECENIDVATEEISPLSELQISPNPATDQLWIRHAPAEVQNIQLLDLHGRLIKEISTSAQYGPEWAGLTTEHEILVSELPAGVYLLCISSNGQRLTRRVVKR